MKIFVKKWIRLFSDSYRELRQVKTIAAMGMFGAISVVLGSLTIVIGDYIKIGFSSVAQQSALLPGDSLQGPWTS